MNGLWQPDPATLMLTAVLITPLIAAADIFLWRQTRDPALPWWAGGAVAMAGGTLVLLTGSTHVAVTMLGGISLILSQWLFYRGVRVQRGDLAIDRVDRVLLAALAGSYPIAVLLDQNLLAPVPASFVVAAIAGACAWTLLYRHDGHARASARFTGTIFALNAMLHVVSAAIGLFAGEAALHWLLVQAASFMLLIGWSFGFLMLIGQRNQERVAALADRDDLTGANTRRALLEKGQHHFAMAARGGPALGVMMLDLDYFKQINDANGHAAGDAVLRDFSRTVGDCLRASDVFGRIGGEEFCVLLPDTGREGTRLVAERIRTGFASTAIRHGSTAIAATVSIGVAVHEEGTSSLEALIGRADEALYRAKHQGRDCVVCADTVTAASPVVRLVWENRFSSGHPAIDREHEYLFGWANALLAKIQANADNQAIEGDVRELLRWLSDHFRHEEELLRKMAWDGLDNHARQHRMLEERGERLLAEVQAGQRNFADILDFIVLEIVARHLGRQDTLYFPLFRAA